jgi:hypothetical protein
MSELRNKGAQAGFASRSDQLPDIYASLGQTELEQRYNYGLEQQKVASTTALQGAQTADIPQGRAQAGQALDIQKDAIASQKQAEMARTGVLGAATVGYGLSKGEDIAKGYKSLFGGKEGVTPGGEYTPTAAGVEFQGGIAAQTGYEGAGITTSAESASFQAGSMAEAGYGAETAGGIAEAGTIEASGAMAESALGWEASAAVEEAGLFEVAAELAPLALSTVCTYASSVGAISKDEHRIAVRYRRMVNGDTFNGYFAMFSPLVWLATNSKIASVLLTPLAVHTSREFVHRADPSMKGSPVGWILITTIKPICFVVGYIKRRLSWLYQQVGPELQRGVE